MKVITTLTKKERDAWNNFTKNHNCDGIPCNKCPFQVPCDADENNGADTRCIINWVSEIIDGCDVG